MKKHFSALSIVLFTSLQKIFAAKNGISDLQLIKEVGSKYSPYSSKIYSSNNFGTVYDAVSSYFVVIQKPNYKM